MYDVTLWCIRITMVAVEMQNAFYVYCRLTCHCQQHKILNIAKNDFMVILLRQ